MRSANTSTAPEELSPATSGGGGQLQFLDHLVALTRLRLALPLVTVVALSLLVRIYADRAGEHIVPYLGTYYTKELSSMADLPWYSYLLPITALDGRWGTTGFLLVHWIELLVGEPGAFYFLTATMVGTGYILAWLMFRSILMAWLFGVGLATTTFNYHAYAVSGSVIMLPLITLVLLFGFCQARWVERGGLRWACASMSTSMLFALSYEGWLDLVPGAWIIYPVLIWSLTREGDTARAVRSALALLVISTVAAAYVTIKNRFGLEGLHPKGGEADLLTTYGGYHLLMLEDVVSSFFTFFYTTITTYFPPELFSFSLSLWHYGPEKVVALQEGYHPQATHLTLFNHLFLWRYYAGFALAVFLMFYVRVTRALILHVDTHHVILFVLMSVVLIGSPSHLVIKWRPMHSAPLLGYQVYLSILGWTLLLCYLVERVARSFGGWRAVALSALLIGDFGYCAYARPALLSCMSSQVFLGTYPDPRLNFGGEASPTGTTSSCGPLPSG